MITFAPVLPDDVEALLGYVRACYSHDHLPFHEAAVREAITGLLSRPDDGGIWFIERGRLRVGYMILTLGYSLEYLGRDAFVDELFVLENERGRGFGRAAITFAVEQCRRWKVRALHLEVERGNLDAQAFYQRVGFVDHDRYLLTKRLPDDAGDQ